MDIYNFYYRFSIVYTLFEGEYKFNAFNINSQFFISYLKGDINLIDSELFTLHLGCVNFRFLI